MEFCIFQIWTKPFIIFIEKFKIFTDWIANNADHDQMLWMFRLTLVCTGCMALTATLRLKVTS